MHMLNELPSQHAMQRPLAVGLSIAPRLAHRLALPKHSYTSHTYALNLWTGACAGCNWAEHGVRVQRIRGFARWQRGHPRRSTQR